MVPWFDASNAAAHAALSLLLDGLLPGALVTLVALLLCRWLGGGARWRHAIWWVALVAVLAAPVLRGSLASSAGAESEVATSPAVTAEATGLPGTSSIPQSSHDGKLTAAAPATVGQPGSSSPARLLAGLLPLVLAAAWAGITTLLLIRLVRSFRRARQITRESHAFEPIARSEQLEVARRILANDAIEVRVSPAVDHPVAVGLARPATILLPESIGRDLSPPELEAILLHERAHLRFHDPWTQLAQRLVEAIVFFHPLVRWIGCRLELERELACDEAVVRRTGAPADYCRTLVRLKELSSGAGHAFAPGAVARRKQIVTRFEHLLGPAASRRAHPSRGRLVAGVGLAAVALAMLLTAVPGLSLPLEPSRLAELRAAWSHPEDPEELGLGGERPVDWTHEVFRLPISATLLTADGQDELATLWVARDELLRTASSGHFEIDAEASALVRLPAGTWFAVLDERRGLRRELDVRPGAAGAPTYRYLVDGVANEFDEEARAWFAPILKRTIRGRADYASDRVEGLWKRGGRDAVLAELERLEDEYTRRRYLEALTLLSGDETD